MGGLGSGRILKSSSRFTESHLAIDLAELHRRRMLEPGTRRIFHWYNGNKVIASLRLLPLDDRIVLGAECFAFARVPWGFGGYRSWFICRCGRRVRILYRPKREGAHIGCRTCLKLRYQSQSEAAYWGARRRGERLKRRVYEAASDFRKEPDKYGFAPKPPRMRQRTYDRLLERYNECQIAFTAGQQQSLDRAEASLNRRYKR